jgi:hypothetical protein
MRAPQGERILAAVIELSERQGRNLKITATSGYFSTIFSR